MIENEPKIVRVEPMAEMFIDRLTSLVDLKDKIDKGTLPFAYWDEISIQPHGKEHWSGSTKGLSYGVNHAIFDAYLTLKELDHTVEANAIINFKKGNRG